MTDRGGPRPLVEIVAAVLDGGGRWFWFRDKDLPPYERRSLAARIAERVGASGGVLSIGGDADLAGDLGAGIHLGGGAEHSAIATARQRVGAALVGVSAHTLRDVEAAAAGGADYVTLSPIFATASKPGYGPTLGVDALAAAARIRIPVIALGGVCVATAAACHRGGAAGMAVMGSLMRAADPAAETRALLRAWATTQEEH